MQFLSVHVLKAHALLIMVQKISHVEKGTGNKKYFKRKVSFGM